MMSEFNYHKPVLLDEVSSFFIKDRKIVYVDMTLGRAGHASHLLEMIKKSSSFYGIDRDKDAIDYSKKILAKYEKKVSLHYLQERFSQATDTLKESGVKGADFIFLDIGVSSPQFDDPSRGFSYRFDSPLDMRMNQDDKLTAKEIVNTYSKAQLIHVFKDLGECPIYLPVVDKIIQVREKEEIKTTFQLVDIIKSALPVRFLEKKGHPAKQFFLGLRYEVNKEIDELTIGLKKAVKFLNPKGRLVIISFNSEEDKIVKTLFKSLTTKVVVDKYLPIMDEEVKYNLLTKKPILPSELEISQNNRTKSSILRAIERR